MSAKETQVVIAQGPYCSVSICRCCEIVHVTVGAMTVRVEPDVLFSVSATLGEAIARLGITAEVAQRVSEAPKGAPRGQPS